jgi:mono/diheme cytochrome c family protein
MRRERWIATSLVAAAVWIAVLSGCGSKQAGNETSGGTEATPTTQTETSAAPTAADTSSSGEVSMELGEKIVQERCVLCHGQDGKGDGPGGAALNPKPRNWTDHSYMGTRTDDQLYDVIYNGKGSMPAWGKTGILKPNEIRSAIMKVRTFDKEYKAPDKG